MFTKNVLTSSIQGAGFELEYLVIAGGGGGGCDGAGGGAGGYRSGIAGEDSGGGASAEAVLVANLGVAYTVTVGGGGAGSTSTTIKGTSGTDTVFSTVTSTGGGGGASRDAIDGLSGGSGGGAGGIPGGSVGTGTANQGFDGGLAYDGGLASGYGGGGGAGQVGQNAGASLGGNGGDGVQSVVTGANTYRAGGGGGGHGDGSPPGGVGGTGGLGGGGNGSSLNVLATAGTTNTGGGGGGGGRQGGYVNGATGGSGVVIIKLPRKIIAEFSAGVVYNYIPVDGFHVYEITAAGVSDTVTFKDGSDIPATIDESLRFNDDDSAYLSRTPASAGNRKTWTWSGWAKRGNLSSDFALLGCTSNETNSPTADEFYFRFNNDNSLYMQGYIGAYQIALKTTSLYRDTSAWYHVVVVMDTSNVTASDRVKFYVNGERITDFVTSTYPSQNHEPTWNSTFVHKIGKVANYINNYFDGYMADIYFIDGQALDPSNFGHADDNGVWQPIAYPGTYGTNGFHLEFDDNSTAAALGTDTSGNGNDFTPSGITTDDQVTDTPSLNYATLNPLAFGGTGVTLSNGNLDFTNAVGNSGRPYSTFEFNTGKWYCEVTVTGGSRTDIGFFGVRNRVTLDYAVYYGLTGNKFINGVQTAYGAAYGLNDVIGIAYDADTGEITFYKNGASQGAFSTGLAGETVTFYFADGSSSASLSATTNFGQLGFAYTPPTGFVALNSSNLPTPTIADGKEHFDIALYTGTGKARTVRGFEFQPDFVWIKQRSGTAYHQLVDAIRGVDKYLFSNATNIEETRTTSITALNSNGFTLGDHGSVNGLNSTFVAWNWNAGGSTVTNTDGTITSQVRANTDAGFSIVTYTGNASYGQTVGHGLGTAPQVVICKNRVNARNWRSYFETLGATKYINLDETSAAGTYGSWNNTAPTSTVFSTTDASAADRATNFNGDDFVAYCFAEVDGFSKFGSYTGNGSTDGPFIYTGFRPAFVMVKRTDAAGYNWIMMDSARSPYNLVNSWLYANLANAQDTSLRDDVLSNGFKVRQSGAGINASGGTYIYMAFAENPFKTARAR